MNNYDNFILQLGDVPDFPKNIYGKVRFRIVAEKMRVPAAAALLCFIFAGIVLFSTSVDNQAFDWDLGADEMVFSQDNNYYALFDD